MSVDSKMALTVDFLREFIEAYRKHPALWKVGSKEYVDKALKKEGYDDLINKCWEFNIAADRDFVVRKINSLRGAFRKEHNKVLAAAARGQRYVPILWYYKLLLFTSDKEMPDSIWKTEPYDESQDQDFNVESTDEIYAENSVAAGIGIESTTSDESRDRKPLVNEQDEVLEDGSPEDHLQVHLDFPKDHAIRPRLYCRPSPYISPRRTYEVDRLSDEYTAIGVSVAAKLRRMDETQRFYAEMLLTKVLGMGLLSKLSENTVINEKIDPSNAQNSES